MPCRGSCLKFRPRAQEYRQDFTNRKSVAAKKKKKNVGERVKKMRSR